MYNPKIPISIRRSPHVFGCSNLEHTSFLDCVCCVPPNATYIPTKLHLSWNNLHFFSFSVSPWGFSKSRNVLKDARSSFVVCAYSNTWSTMIFYATFISPRSLDNTYHSICSFIHIATNVGAAFRASIVINFHRRFPSGMNNASLSHDSYSATTCQYPLSISTAIKYFASGLVSCTATSQLGMGKANGRVIRFNLR